MVAGCVLVVSLDEVPLVWGCHGSLYRVSFSVLSDLLWSYVLQLMIASIVERSWGSI